MLSLNTFLQRENNWTSNFSNLFLIIGRKSQLSLANELLVYKTILKPIWVYGVQLWGSASTSNLEILERFQSKVLRIITDAPWYVPKAVIKLGLHVLSVRQEARNYSVTYRQKLQCHLPTETTVSPTDKGLTITTTAWQNPYFKEQITILGSLSGIIPLI